MPFTTGFQLSLELAKAFPVRSITESAGTKLLKYARDLRRSGSDIVVEADLAEVFGRGKIVQEIERSFREAVKVQSFTFFRDGCEISLDSGAGPTILHAFRNNQHFSTIVQLSFLAWTHDRSSLATAIDEAMVKRFEMGVAGASASPGYEGILGSLAACSSQSNAFAWSDYIHLVDNKLRDSIPGYQYSRDLMKLSPAALTGAMDFLYLVQQLRESRKILISNAMGAITFVIWAHYILGLNVLITSKVSSTIAFGDEQNPHVLIVWSNLVPDSASLYQVSSSHIQEMHPSIQLLDEDMSVILDLAPDSERWTEIAVETRYPLLGYGATYLHRMFNADIITNDHDPIYEESVKLIIAIAIWVSRRVDRDMDIILSPTEVINLPSPQRDVSIDIWRILASARILFSNMFRAADTSAIDAYVERLSRDPLDESTLPNICTTFLKKVPVKPRRTSPGSRYMFQLRCLASMVLVFSFVTEIEDCSDLPLREVAFVQRGFQNDFHEACKVSGQRLRLKHDTIFQQIKSYLSRQEISENVFLYCDFGWSVYFDTFCGRDPTQVKPELVHVRKGVPTNRKTMERKMFICDGHMTPGPMFNTTNAMKDDSQTIRGRDYVPRSSATASCAEFWSTGAQAFQHAIYYRVNPKQEWRERGREPFQVFSYCCGMQNMLWETFTTAPCDHSLSDSRGPVKLGMDAAAVLGWSSNQDAIEEVKERFLICLTKGEPGVRWLAAKSSIFLGRRNIAMESQTHPGLRVREVMLRTEDCCDSCALEQTAAVPGNHYWILIL
ncbi:MAG: hypothetical protein L6R40_000242 [Gallowayella cf. fulva]|nr:MAG: hypothetical protein L6R40_000242 [Xanthomendoza cf. fulva]